MRKNREAMSRNRMSNLTGVKYHTKSCSVKGCSVKKYAGSEVLFHRFPANVNRCREWVKRAGNSKLEAIPLDKVHSRAYICQNHFTSDQYVSPEGQRLIPLALPSIFPSADESLISKSAFASSSLSSGTSTRMSPFCSTPITSVVSDISNAPTILSSVTFESLATPLSPSPIPNPSIKVEIQSDQTHSMSASSLPGPSSENSATFPSTASGKEVTRYALGRKAAVASVLKEMDQSETEDTLETEAELSTSGEPLAKKRKPCPVEKREILKMTEEDLRELIEAMSTDEEEDDSSDSSDSDFDLGESEVNEDDDNEDVELGTTWDDASSNPLTTPMTSMSSIADSKSHEIGQPECSKFSTIGSLNLKAKGNSPRDFFNLMANERFFDLVITETNKQAKEVNLTKSSIKLGEWKDLSKVEFETFLGLLFHMGTIRTNNLNDYWNKNHLFYLKCISNHMRRDRFRAILKFLNFAEIPHDYDQMHDDKLYKIKPLLDIFHENVSNFESSDKELSGRESMVLWRGHLVFCQFKKNKRHRYGIKLYKLTEPSGLVLRLLVYICSANELSGKKKMDEIAHRLADDQWEKQIRKYAEVSSEKATRCKEKHNWNDEEDCVLKWKDKHEVMVVNTEFGTGLIDVPNRRLAEYNRFKGNIYSSDQFMANYPLERRAMKWYKKLGIHIFQMMLLNSYFLYRKYRDPKVTLYEFRLKVIDSLLPLNAGVFPCPPSPKAIIRHFPDLLTNSSSNSSRRIQKRCRVCYKKGIRRRITIFCPDCPEEPGLCLRPCFLEYHEKMFSLNE